MPRPRLRHLWPLLLSGCGAPPAALEPIVAQAPPIEIETEKVAPQVRWRYHPPTMAQMRDGHRFEDGSWLLVGELGERWLTDPLPREPPSAKLGERAPRHAVRASRHRAPEALITMLALPDDAWMFVGQSGAIYRSDSALGPFTIGAQPPRALIDVVQNRGTLIGLTRVGGMMEMKDGRWGKESFDAGRLFDITALADGTLLGLGAPERLVMRKPGASAWTPIPSAPLGVTALAPVADDMVIVRARGGDRLWRGKPSLDADLRDARGAARLPTDMALDLDASQGPVAEALLDGEAAWSGSRYVQAFDNPARAEGDAPKWHLALGTVGDDLDEVDVPWTCTNVHVGMHERTLVAACVMGDDRGNPIRVKVRRSDDGGRQWRDVAAGTTRDGRQIGVAVTEGGAALVSAVCAASPCTATSALRIDASGRLDPQPVATPGMAGPASAPVFSEDASHVYWLGRRTKDGRLALFVSDDGGRRFQMRELPAGNVPNATTGTLHPGADGELGIAVHSATPRYWVTDEDGVITHTARLPEGTTAVSGYGRWVAAFGPEPKERRSADARSRITAWESGDGGQRFRPIGIPMGITADETGTLQVVCGSGGCVLGDRATRLGWGEPESPETSVRVPRRLAPERAPAIETPIVCTTDAKVPWQTIGNVHGDRFPRARHAWRGDTAWSALEVDDTRGEVRAAWMDAKGKLTRHTMLSGVGKRTGIALEVAHQMEGYASARVRLPAKGPRGGTALRGLEVAWVNLMNGTRGRHPVKVKATLREQDVGPGPHPTLITGLLSVSPDGIFVRPQKGIRTTHFLKLDGSLEGPFQYPDFPSPAGTLGQVDAVAAQGKRLGVAMHYGQESRMVRMLATHRLDGGPLRWLAATPPDDIGLRVTTRWDYRAGNVGFSVVASEAEERRAFAYFAPFLANGSLGPAVALPTLANLRGQAAGCSKAQRTTTPRLVTRPLPRDHRPVLVDDGGQRLVLLSDHAVVHGDPTTPCVAAWEASGIEGTSMRHGALVEGGLKRSWLFRDTPGVKNRSFDFRPMSCRYEPKAVVPPSVWRVVRRQRP